MNNYNYNSRLKILIVDDEYSVRDSLTKWLKEFGYNVDSAVDAAEALSKVKERKRDIVFLDIRLPDMNGTDLNRKIREIDPAATTVMITAYASVDTAVKSLKDGAFDYMTKPIDPDYLSHLITKITEQKRLVEENAILKEQIEELMPTDDFIGESPQIKKVLEMIRAVAPTDTTVMIRGESGTGKELLARKIHALSPRRNYPIVTVNCGGLTVGLAESEFFGHEKGAFTGGIYRRKGKLELAHRGTVFLDEIGCIDPKTQTDLLRAIETKKFTRVGGNEEIEADFRTICATNRNLEDAVKSGEFREDLYYRLNVFSITIPPLRERRSDIPILADSLLKQIASSLHKSITGLSPEAMQVLTNHDWFGNVRELRNCLERAAVISKESVITVNSLGLAAKTNSMPKQGSLESVEKAHIQEILNETGGNITHAADILRIDRTTLYNKIEKYGLRK
jgi:DNA-binding NtrC family response regulator